MSTIIERTLRRRWRVALVVLVVLALAASAAEASARPARTHRLVVSAQRGGQLDLWAINDDGSNPIQLTIDALDDQQPAVSPDGRSIVFARGVAFDSVPPTSDLWIMDADGGNQRTLVADPVAAEYRPSFSPDGTTVLFTRHVGPVAQSIWTTPIDGSSAPTMIIDNATYAHWGPDGRIVYASDPNGDSQITVANADGSNANPITTLGGVAPQWSADGARIVFTTFRSGRGQIFVINADGTGERQLEANNVLRTAGFGTWSPDGKRIAFSSTRDMSCPASDLRDCPRRIYTINADGTSVRPLPTGSDMDQYPTYVPTPSRRRSR